MDKHKYQHLSSDSESTDSTMIDFNNTRFDADNMPLLDSEINSNSHTISNYNNTNYNNYLNNHYRNSNRVARQIMPMSSYYKNGIVKRLYWGTFLACLFATPGFVLNALGYIQTASSSGNDVYNIDIEYLYYYFFILMLFYTSYIGFTLIILIVTFCKNLAIESSGFPLLITNILFKVNIIFRMIVIGIITIRMIDNTPFIVIPVTNTSITVNNDKVNVYLPRHIEYLIIENIVYTYLAYINGINTGIIKILINY
jgi:hypothetical protein